MIRPHQEILDLIRAYTGRPTAEDALRAEYQLREQIKATARELEEIAAELQGMADELRELTR